MILILYYIVLYDSMLSYIIVCYSIMLHYTIVCSAYPPAGHDEVLPQDRGEAPL